MGLAQQLRESMEGPQPLEEKASYHQIEAEALKALRKYAKISPRMTRDAVLKSIVMAVTKSPVVMDAFRERFDEHGEVDYHAGEDILGGPLAAWKDEEEIDSDYNPKHAHFDELSRDAKLRAMLTPHVKKWKAQGVVPPGPDWGRISSLIHRLDMPLRMAQSMERYPAQVQKHKREALDLVNQIAAELKK
jgi:hypothetical protein